MVKVREVRTQPVSIPASSTTKISKKVGNYQGHPVQKASKKGNSVATQFHSTKTQQRKIQTQKSKNVFQVIISGTTGPKIGKVVIKKGTKVTENTTKKAVEIKNPKIREEFMKDTEMTSKIAQKTSKRAEQTARRPIDVTYTPLRSIGREVIKEVRTNPSPYVDSLKTGYEVIEDGKKLHSLGRTTKDAIRKGFKIKRIIKNGKTYLSVSGERGAFPGIMGRFYKPSTLGNKVSSVVKSKLETPLLKSGVHKSLINLGFRALEYALDDKKKIASKDFAADAIVDVGKGVISGVGGALLTKKTTAVGAAIGTAICPGIGTVVGGAIGFIGGVISTGKLENLFEQHIGKKVRSFLKAL